MFNFIMDQFFSFWNGTESTSCYISSKSFFQWSFTWLSTKRRVKIHNLIHSDWNLHQIHPHLLSMASNSNEQASDLVSIATIGVELRLVESRTFNKVSLVES